MMLTTLIKVNMVKWLQCIGAATGGFVLGFVLPLVPFLGATLFLVVCDLYTGIQAAKKKGEEIRSRGLRRTTRKVTLYFVGILGAHVMFKTFFEPKGLSVDLVWAVSGWICFTEFKSNLENISDVTGTDIWAQVKGRITAAFNFKNGK